MSYSSNGVQIDDNEEKCGIISAFRSAVKCFNYFYHIVFLECCQHVDVIPDGVKIRKQSFIQFNSSDITALWNSTITSTEKSLLDSLLVGLHEKMLQFEITFWDELGTIEEDEGLSYDDILEWWVKLVRYCEKEEDVIKKRKCRKIRKMLKDNSMAKMEICLRRFDEHLDFFDFKSNFQTMGTFCFLI